MMSFLKCFNVRVNDLHDWHGSRGQVADWAGNQNKGALSGMNTCIPVQSEAVKTSMQQSGSNIQSWGCASCDTSEWKC
jgi:hypothetical protein